MALAHPLYAVIEESATGVFSALCYDLELGAQGDTEFEALDDLREQVAELFLALTEMEKDLPPHLARRLAFLRQIARQCL